MTAGYRTSEFWLTAAMLLVVGLVACGVGLGPLWLRVVALVLGTWVVAWYTFGRTELKLNDATRLAQPPRDVVLPFPDGGGPS